jgi:hypothetical protein
MGNSSSSARSRCRRLFVPTRSVTAISPAQIARSPTDATVLRSTPNPARGAGLRGTKFAEPGRGAPKGRRAKRAVVPSSFGRLSRPEQLAKLRRDDIGFVFQSFHLFPTMTAPDNVRLGALRAR